MTGQTNCEICSKLFKWRKSKIQKAARFCSIECKNKAIKTWTKHEFKWKDSTEDEKLKRASIFFEKNVIKLHDCWDWNGTIHRSGYAVMNYNNKQTSAHRISWMLNFGKIPDKLIIMHKCDNKKCTNPEHLSLGTPKNNTQDMLEKGRGRPKYGENHPFRKLDDNKVREIRKLLTMGVSVGRICKDFEISQGALDALRKGITWKHVK